MKNRIIVYGLGNVYQKEKHIIDKYYDVIGYSDIDTKKRLNEKYIIPQNITKQEFEYVLVTPLFQKKNITNYLVNECGINVDRLKYWDYEKKRMRKSKWKNNIQFSYAENAEDFLAFMALQKLGINEMKDIKYIELGVNEPIYNSNTFFFYEKGARGILVEANPDAINFIKAIRPEDKIINKAIFQESDKEIDFYISEEEGLSSITEKHFKKEEKWNCFQRRKIKIKTISINDIFRNMPNIDILSIDIEGYDYKALESLEENYKPKIIIVEMLEGEAFEADNKAIFELLNNRKYELFACTETNGIWIYKDEVIENEYCY